MEELILEQYYYTLDQQSLYIIQNEEKEENHDHQCDSSSN